MAKQTKAEKAAYMAAYYQRTKHLKNASCYLIYKVTNTINGKFYIGITMKLLRYRLKAHENSAANGRRGKFMTAIRKYGIDAFRIEQIDTAKGLDEANQKEMHYVATLLPHYNNTLGGDGTAGFSNPKTEIWKRQMSKIRKAHWQDPLVNFRMRIGSSKAQKANTPKALKSGRIHEGRDRYWTPEKIRQRSQKSVESKSLIYTIECPDGSVIEVRNLQSFCREKGIDNSNLNNTAPGRRMHGCAHKGYKLLSRGVRGFASLTDVARFLGVSRTSARNLRNNNQEMFLRAVNEMKHQKIIPKNLSAFPNEQASS